MTMVPSRTADFLVIGGGIIGVSVARSIRSRWPDASVVLVEKETSCGQHASRRNSGVLHAGFYYDKDSLKARFSREGNERLARYCNEKELPLSQCGKLIVARDAQDLPGLDELARRGEVNGVELHRVTPREAADIEPRARTFGSALFSPRTATVDPGAVVDSLVSDARATGVDIQDRNPFVGLKGTQVATSRGAFSAGFVVNAAGLQADRVAQEFGFGREYRILPFKGLYLESTRGAPEMRTHVYPVPDSRYPFLGVHLTRTVSGTTKVGPTALPALWREQYSGLRGFRSDELVEIGIAESRMLLTDRGFRRLAFRELRRCSQRVLLKRASELVPDVQETRDWKWGAPGIRAQLQNRTTGALVSDFVLEGNDRSMHILNAVSPAFTCALPFADYVVDRIARDHAGEESKLT